MLKRLLTTCSLMVIATAILSSCSSTKLVKITVDPPEAMIFLDGKQVGTGTYEKILDFTKRPSYEFEAKMEKFADVKLTVNFKPETEIDFPIKLKRMYAISVPLIDFSATKTRTGMTVGLKEQPTISYYDVAEKSGDVKGLVIITQNKDKDTYFGGPVLAPNDDFLLYRTLDAEDGKQKTRILMQKVGSKSTTRIVDEKRALVLFPTLTPDGSGYIFCSNRISGQFALWRRKFKGTGRTKLSGGFNQDFSSSVSPNGAKVAFTCLPADGEELQVWTIDTNSGLSTQLGTGLDPQVSPDGKRIMFLQKAPESTNTQIWMMDFEGGERTQLTANEAYSVKDARWSPDGTMIIFASNNGKDDKGRNNFDIWMMKADGSEAQQLTSNGSHDDKPCFDRHGDQVYFRSNRGTHWNIWSFKLDKRFSDSRQGFEMK